MRIYNFTTKQWEDDEEKKNKYQVSRMDDGTMTIGGGGKNAVPSSVWKNDPAYASARKAIESGKIADFNSGQARLGAAKGPVAGSQDAAWSRGVAGLTMKPKEFTPLPMPEKKFVPLPTSFQQQKAPAMSTGNANMDLRLQNAGVLSYTNARRQGQASPAELALQKRQAYQAQQAKAAEDTVAANQMAKTMTIDDFLAKPEALTEAEKKAASKVLKVLDSQYRPIQIAYQGSPRDGMGARILPEDVRIMLSKMDALRLKTKGSEAALYGVLDSVTFGASNRMEAGENNRRLEEYQKKMAAGQALTKAEQADLLMLQSLGGKTSFEAAREAHPLAYGGAKYASEAIKYALGNAGLELIPGVGTAMGKAGSWISQKTGGKISAEVAKRLVEGRVQDLPFDIINAAVETDNAADFAKNIGFNQALGLGMDVGAEAVAAGWRAIKNAVQDGRLELPDRLANLSGQEIGAYTMPQDPAQTGIEPLLKATEEIKAKRQEALDAPIKIAREAQEKMKAVDTPLLASNLMENRRLNGLDFRDYMETGNRKDILSGKQNYLSEFGDPILATKEQSDKFLMQAIDTDTRSIAAFGKVGQNFSDQVKSMSGNKISIDGYYLELDAHRVFHMRDHMKNDPIPVTAEQIKNLPDIIMDAEILDVTQRKNGEKIITLGKEINGYSIVIEMASQKRRSLAPKTMYNIDTDEFIRRYKKNSNDIPGTHDTKASLLYTPEATRQSIAANNSIPPEAQIINGQSGGNLGGGSGRLPPNDPILQSLEQAQARRQEALAVSLDLVEQAKAKKQTALEESLRAMGVDGYGKNTVGAAESAFPHKQEVSKSYSNTFQKTPMFSQAEKALANAAGMDKTYSYDVISERQSMAEAAQRFALDAAGEMEDLPKKGSWGSGDLDTAMLILEQKRDAWRKTGNSEDLRQWAKLVQEKGTEAGQMIQAFAKYSRTPEGTIVKAEGAIADYGKKLRDANPKLFKAIDRFADELAQNSDDFLHDLPADPDAAVGKLKTAIEDFAKKHGKVKLDESTTDEIIRAIQEGRGGKDALGEILEAAQGIPRLGVEEIDRVMDIMGKAEDLPLYSKERWKLENQAWKIVADHFDSSFMDKWNAWRYMAMLGNTRTHIRNMVGNTVFGAAVKIKDRLGAALEGVTDNTIRAFGGEGIDRTKSIFAPLDRELGRAAKSDFNDMYALITGNGKYNPSDMLRDNMTVFKPKWLEKLRKLNLDALEAEDAVALKARYADSLAGWLKANGYGAAVFKDPSEAAQDVLTRARAYAIEQAQKATFRDNSALASALQKASHSSKAANVIIEGIVPFKKTPINIVKRGVEYSPAGLAKGVVDAVSAIKTGKKTAAQAIDEIAAGMTGTGILYLGYKLAESGLITGSGREDSRERGFDAMTGNQNYALVIDGKSYTLDWAAPAALPLFVGAELYKTKGRDLTGAGLLDSVTKITEPVLDMTMMQGLNDAIQSAAYDQTGPLASIGINAVSNYATQAVPTLFGQVARAVDDTRRSTYYGGGAFLGRYLPEGAKEAAKGNPLLDKAVNAALPRPVDIALQKTMAKLPGASMLLNPKVDQWGREQKNQGGSIGGRLAYNMLSPGFYSERNVTDVDREIERLYGESGEKGVLPGYASKTIAQKDAEGNKETKRLDAREFVTFAKDKGGAAYKSLETLFGSDAYQGAEDADKAKMVADIYEYTNAAAKVGVSKYKPSGWVAKAMEAGKAGIPLEDYVLCKNVLQPLKHNVEKNTALLNMDADPKTKEVLYRYFVSDSDGSRKKIDALKAAGLDMDDFLTAQIEYAHIDDKGGSAQEKATAFYRWLDGQSLNQREYQAVAESMPFFQMFPAKPEAYRVDMMSDSGKKKWAKAQAWGLSEKQYVKYYKVATQQKKKAEILADLQKAGMTAAQAAYFWSIVKGK